MLVFTTFTVLRTKNYVLIDFLRFSLLYHPETTSIKYLTRYVFTFRCVKRKWQNSVNLVNQCLFSLVPNNEQQI